MVNWEPYWTEEVTIEKGGRYPLLLNRFHDHLENSLIVGIVSVVDRLRYVSYCCWIIGDINKTIDCKTFDEFKNAFIMRESAYAIGIYLSRPLTLLGNYTTYGEEIMRSRINIEGQKQDCLFSILKSKSMGAFEQYYRGTLQNWGLINSDEIGVIHLTEFGERLYRIMDSFYVHSDYYNFFKGKRYVPSEVLKEWAHINEYDNIRDDAHQEERDFFKEVLFHLDVVEAKDFRRDTLRIYLECIMMCNQHSIKFSELVLSDFLYYGKMQLHDNKGFINVILSEKLNDALFYWKIYEIQAHYRWWISELFRLLLRRLQANPQGMTLEEIIASVERENFNRSITQIIGLSEDYYSLSFQQLHLIIKQINNSSERFVESSLREIIPGNLSHAAGLLVIALALLYDQYLLAKKDYRFRDIIMKTDGDYWFNSFFQNIGKIYACELPRFLEHIVLHYIFDKHDRAMFEKKDMRRSWFVKSLDKYQYRADSTSIWRPAKNENICNMLFDMKLIDLDDDSFIISNEGQELYSRLKEEYYHE